MIPPAPRSARLRPLVLLALAVTVTASLTACSSTDPDPAAHTAGPTGSATVEPTPTPSPTPTMSPTPIAPPVSPDLAAYLAQIPTFGPAPRPDPVQLSRNPGQSAFAFDLATTKRVAFLTIDDGAFRHPMALELIKAAKVPVTLFLTTNYVAGHQDYFQALKDTGYVTIENHTVSHPSLPGEGYEGARNQLCTASDRLAEWYGERPTLFRPPFGNRDASTLQAAWDCGLKAGFYWRETVDGGNVYYQRDEKYVYPGDIILMHFRPAFPDDFLIALIAIHNSGLSVGRLEDWIRVDGDTTPTAPPPQGLAPFDAPPATEPEHLQL